MAAPARTMAPYVHRFPSMAVTLARRGGHINVTTEEEQQWSAYWPRLMDEVENGGGEWESNPHRVA
jgi:hypothetical protein